jgi:hypothetical protein
MEFESDELNDCPVEAELDTLELLVWDIDAVLELRKDCVLISESDEVYDPNPEFEEEPL